jgi:hypothetical protein
MSRATGLAVASLVLAAVFLAVGYFGGDEDESVGVYLVVLAVDALLAAARFWWLAPRYVERPATPALVLAIVGAVSLVVFWLGFPVILAGAAVLLGLEARERGVGGAIGTAALVIAGLTAVAFAAACVFG